MYKCINTCIYKYIHVYMCIRIYVYMYICIYAYIYESLYAYMYMCVNVYMCMLSVTKRAQYFLRHCLLKPGPTRQDATKAARCLRLCILEPQFCRDQVLRVSERSLIDASSKQNHILEASPLRTSTREQVVCSTCPGTVTIAGSILSKAT